MAAAAVRVKGGGAQERRQRLDRAAPENTKKKSSRQSAKIRVKILKSEIKIKMKIKNKNEKKEKINQRLPTGKPILKTSRLEDPQPDPELEILEKKAVY